MGKVSQWFKAVLRPWAAGVLLTFGIVYLALQYYAADIDTRETHPNVLVNVFHRLHQASIDWKMRIRGWRAGSGDVVVVAVDEKSLEQEGQWPWPRRKMSQVIENLMAQKVKVIGFDVIWPEEEQNTSVFALQKLRREFEADERVAEKIDRHMQEARSDLSLGETVEKYADRLVMGSYFDPPILSGFRYPDRGYKNLCLELIYRSGENFAKWENLDPTISVIDQSVIGFSDEMPTVFREILLEKFRGLEDEVRESGLQARREMGLPETLSETAQIEVENKIELAKWSYCQRWLDSVDEELEKYRQVWPQVREESESLANLSFEQGLTAFKDRYLGLKAELVGKWVMNIDSIQRRSTYVGYFNAKQDSDGTIRRSHLMVRSGQSFFPSLAFNIYLLGQGLRAQVTLQPDTSGIETGFKHISAVELMNEDGEVVGQVPVNKEGYLTINYAGPEKMFPYVSIADVLNDEPTVMVIQRVFDPQSQRWMASEKLLKKTEFFKDKLILLGVTAVGLFDLRVTPFQENFPGVETHANVLDNLLRRDFLQSHSAEEPYMLAFMLAVGLLFSYLVSRFGALQGSTLVIGMVLAMVLVDWHFFFKKGLVTALAFPVVLLLSVYVVLTVIKYFTEEKNKKQLKGTFGKYVSPAIVEEILAHPDNIELGGRKEHVTVFFSDVRGFTTISETLSPTELGDLLNEYLTPMTEIIFQNNGTLDKYIGDAIMAFFGAPIRVENHAKQACRAALGNVRKLLELQADWQERNLPHIDIGIGLNTGDVSVGNMGSNIVRNYTIMGDSVNLGARLEGITKQYGVRIVISEYTEKEIGDEFLTREIDWVRVKGKNLPVRIFELIDEAGVDPLMENVVNCFGEGYRLYHGRQWAEAAAKFRQALEIKPDDAVSQLYIDRCEEFLNNPPPADWDGVFVMTTK